MKTKLLKLALCAAAMLPMGTWAAEKNSVSGFEMWTFDQYHDGEAVSLVTNYGQLYLRANTSHPVSFTKSQVDVTFTYNNLKFRVGNCAEFSANTSFAATKTFAARQKSSTGESSNSTDRSLALEFTVAGKLYLWVRASNITGGVGKKLSAAVVNSETVETKTVHTFTEANKNPFEVSVDIDANKHYAIYGETAFRVYAVAFVPTNYDFTSSSSNARRRVSFDDGNSGTYDYVTFMTDYPCTLDTKRFKAYYASESDGSKVTLAEYSGNVLAANTPVVLKYLKYDETTNINMQLASSTGTIVTPANNLLKPVYADTYALPATYSTYTNYILAKEGTSYVFAPSTGDGSIQNWYTAKNSSNYLNVGKAYLAINNPTTARNLDIVFEDDVTAISNVSAKVVNDGKYYNLQGVEVAQPAKGMYIVNGKKVIIK